MKDTIQINSIDANHFIIARVMEEVVDRANLEERERSLKMQIEALEDQLDTLKKNLKTVQDALKHGKGHSTKEINNIKAVGDR